MYEHGREQYLLSKHFLSVSCTISAGILTHTCRGNEAQSFCGYRFDETSPFHPETPEWTPSFWDRLARLFILSYFGISSFLYLTDCSYHNWLYAWGYCLLLNELGLNCFHFQVLLGTFFHVHIFLENTVDGIEDSLKKIILSIICLK